jgi:hypothetical protein
MKVFGAKFSPGRLGRLVFLEQPRLVRGGSSILGDVATRGEVEKVDPESDTSEGAPSTDSALEASDVEGDGRDISAWRLDL